MLYVQLRESSTVAAMSSPSRILAIDLATGSQRWRASDNIGGRVTLVRADGANLLAIDSQAAGGKIKPRLIRISMQSGNVTGGPTAPLAIATDLLSIVAYEQNGTIMAIRPMGNSDGHAIIALRR